MERNTAAVMVEVLRENRELRAENVRLSALIRSSEVTTQLNGTSAPLPSITPTVESSPSTVDVSSSDQQEAVSPKQWHAADHSKEKNPKRIYI